MQTKLLVVLIGVVFIVFIIGSVGLTMVMYREARRAQEVAITARYQAEIGRRRAEAMSEFFAASMQAEADQQQDAGDISVGEMLDRAATTAETSFDEDPQAEAGVRLAIGRGYLNLGEYDKAEAELLRAHELEETPKVIEALVELYEKWDRLEAAAIWKLKLRE